MDSARQYRIQRMVPQGELGELYLAEQVTDSRGVLLRRLARQAVRRPGPAARVLRQAFAVAGMSHPNLARVIAIGESGGSYFIVSEHVQGLSLDRLLRTTEGPLSPPVALGVAHGVALGLEFLHDRRVTGLSLEVVHGALGAGGILISMAGEVKISPIGSAGVPPVGRGPTLTTPAWIEGGATPESALPGIGSLLMLMLTGSTSPTSHSAILERLEPFPREVSSLVARTLEDDSGLRFASLAAMRQSLAAQLDPSEEPMARLGRLVGRALSTDATLRAEDGYPVLFEPERAVTGSDPTLPAVHTLDHSEPEADSCQTLTLQLVVGSVPSADLGFSEGIEETDTTPAEPFTPITQKHPVLIEPGIRPVDDAPSAELDLARAAAEWQATLGTSQEVAPPTRRRGRRALLPLFLILILVLVAAGAVAAWHLVKNDASSPASGASAVDDLAASPAPVATPLVDPARDGGSGAASRPASRPAASGLRRITISSHPPAVLFLGERRLGPIPQHVEIPSGATDPLPLRFLNLTRGLRVTRELDPSTERRSIQFLFTKGQLAFDLPGETEVELDGKALGPEPSPVEVFEGRHKVVLRREGKRRVKWVEVKPGKTTRVRLR